MRDAWLDERHAKSGPGLYRGSRQYSGHAAVLVGDAHPNGEKAGTDPGRLPANLTMSLRLMAKAAAPAADL